jgi:hypothetical protein
LLITLASLILLLGVSYGVLRSSRVQTWLVQKVAAYLSGELQTQVRVGGLDISFFLNIILEDVEVLDRDEQSMIYTRKMTFDIEKISLRNRFLSINKLVLDQAFFGLSRYEGNQEHNFQFVLDYFSNENDTMPRKPWDVICKSFEFKNSGFNFHDFNHPRSEFGFDPGFLSISGLYMEMNQISLDKDTLRFELERLSFQEQENFNLNWLSGSFMISPQHTTAKDLRIRTGSSDLSVEVLLSHDDYDSFSNFLQEVDLNLNVVKSHIDFEDIGYFFPYFHGMSGRLDILGKFKGPVSNIRASDIILSYGKITKFSGGFHLNGLPDIDETFINFYVTEFKTNSSDLEAVRMPHWAQNPTLTLPQGFATLGNLKFDGRVTGFINDFMASGNLTSRIGQASSDMQFRRQKGQLLTDYRGSLKASNFDLGAFLDKQELLGKVSFTAEIVGRGFSLETMQIDFNGKIGNLTFSDYDYQNLELSGSFNNRKFAGGFLIDDENLQLAFNGLISFEQDLPVFDFNAILSHANLSKLNIYQRDSLYESGISSRIEVTVQGPDLENMAGILKTNDLKYYEISTEDGEIQVHYSDNITITNRKLDHVHQHLSLRSGVMEADLHGKFLFRGLLFSFREFAEVFLPALFSREELVYGNNQYLQDFIFDFRLKDTKAITSLFFPAVSISPNSGINGAFDSGLQELFFSGFSNEVWIGGSLFDQLEVSGSRKENLFRLNLETNRIALTDERTFEQFNLETNFVNDTVLYSMKWGDHRAGEHGYLQGTARFDDAKNAIISIQPSYAFLNGSLWELQASEDIFMGDSRIIVSNLMIYKNQESLQVDGVISKDPDDFMDFNFKNFNIDNFDFLLRDRNLEFSGLIDGTVSLGSLRQTPNINAGFQVRDFGFNGDHLGDLKINSSWDNEKRGFKVDAGIIYSGNIGQNIPLSVAGFFYPERKDNSFDLDIKIENLKMSIFARYLSGFAQNFRGLASGQLRLEGPASKPELSGKARLVRTGFRVEYLNASYTFAHEIELGKDYFRFNDLVLNDSLGNSATLNGHVYHNIFNDFHLDLYLRPERFNLMNTTFLHNDLYYGRAFMTGLAHVHGPVNDIVLDISGRTNRGTQIFLPLDYTGEVIENNFITFVTRDSTFIATPFSPPDITGITLNFDLEVTPDAEVQLIFDSQIGDIIRGRGAGNLKFEITSQGSFNMYGDYTIEDGDYLFTLQNLINKRFRIEQGGSIRWTGDPYDADIDLRAVYRLRTSLYDLMMHTDTSDIFRRRVPVETVLILRDKLFNPSVAFDIQLPASDEATREIVQRMITTDQEMNRQVFSLLVLNRFMPSSFDQYNIALGYGLGSTSTEFISNQFSNWLSQISSDFDIGINYRPGDEISSQELEVALSTQFFDDRVTIDGNVGYAGNNHLGNHRTSNMIGDVVVEVKITPEGKFRVKAFNRSNTFDLINTNSPYSQGVGIFYRREFDSIQELFRRTRRISPETVYPEEYLLENTNQD